MAEHEALILDVTGSSPVAPYNLPGESGYDVSKYPQVKRRRQRMREYIRGLKVGKECSVCGESDMRVLEFHHMDPGGKDFAINMAVTRGYSKEKILAETEKCSVVCRNCHAIIHCELAQSPPIGPDREIP